MTTLPPVQSEPVSATDIPAIASVESQPDNPPISSDLVDSQAEQSGNLSKSSDPVQSPPAPIPPVALSLVDQPANNLGHAADQSNPALVQLEIPPPDAVVDQPVVDPQSANLPAPVEPQLVVIPVESEAEPVSVGRPKRKNTSRQPTPPVDNERLKYKWIVRIITKWKAEVELVNGKMHNVDLRHVEADLNDHDLYERLCNNANKANMTEAEMEQKARDRQRDWELYPDSIPMQTRNNNKKHKPTTQHKKARWGVCCRCAHAAPGYDETPFFCAHCNETSTPCPLVQMYGAPRRDRVRVAIDSWEPDFHKHVAKRWEEVNEDVDVVVANFHSDTLTEDDNVSIINRAIRNMSPTFVLVLSCYRPPQCRALQRLALQHPSTIFVTSRATAVQRFDDFDKVALALEHSILFVNAPPLIFLAGVCTSHPDLVLFHSCGRDALRSTGPLRAASPQPVKAVCTYCHKLLNSRHAWCSDMPHVQLVRCCVDVLCIHPTVRRATSPADPSAGLWVQGCIKATP